MAGEGEFIARFRGDTTDLDAAAKRATQSITAVANSAQKVEATMGRFSTSTNRGAQALMNMQRIVQDAPFGFIGISNNIDPLVSSFKTLAAEAGGVGGALKILGSTLAGPAGILFAISTAVSLFTAFGGALFSSGREADSASQKLKRYKEAIDALSESVGRINRDIALQSDITTAALSATGADGTRIMEARVAALQQQVENIAGKQLGISTRQLQKPQVRERIINDLKQILDLTDDDLKTERAKKAAQQAIVAIEEINSLSARIQISKLNNEQRIREEQEKQQKDEIRKTDAYLKELRRQVEELDRISEENQKKAATLFIGLKTPPTNQIGSNLQEDTPGRIQRNQGTLAKITKAVADADKEAAERNREHAAALTKTAQAINDFLTPAFDGLFSAMEQGSNALQAFFDGLRQSVRALIQQMIQAAIVAAAIKFLFPGLAGDNTFGQLFGKIFTGQGLAKGGIVPQGFPGDSFPARLSSGEAVIPLDRLHQYVGGASGSNSWELAGILDGDSIRLMARRTEKKQRRGG